MEERDYCLAFSVFTGIGPVRFKLLVEGFGSAKKAYTADKKRFLEIGLPEKLVDNFVVFRNSFDIVSYKLRLADLRISVLTVDQDAYPKLLKEIDDRPIVLYVKVSPSFVPLCGTTAGKGGKITNGVLEIFTKPAVAIVGTRNITGYGRLVTERITTGLVDAGIVVVSGLARGVDGVAHETVIKNGGLTIAVLGHGLDRIYPPEHTRLASEIVASGGALVSEFPLGLAAVPGNFPARNRIISGLSLGVVVTEAAEDSGSLITASAAGAQGREVFAVPGPITSPNSAGTSQLLKKGAKLVSSVTDILEEIGISGKKQFKTKDVSIGVVLTEDEKAITGLLINETLTVDQISQRLGQVTSRVSASIAVLEIKGVIRLLDNGEYGLV